MAGDSSFSFLLEDSFTEHDKSMEDYSAVIKDALENFMERYNAEVLQQALQQCLHSCPDHLLEEKIVHETLPFAYRLLCQALERIADTISISADEDAIDDTRRQLLVCKELLDVWEKCMERVSKLPKTSCIKLRCTIENVLLAIKLIFEHCKASKNLYGKLFGNVSDELTNLFRKAKTILNLFLTALDAVIEFDTDAELDTELLIKVIDSMGSFVTIVHELDLKTFVETSKVFGKLSLAHQNSVKRRNVRGVTSHLAPITRDVSSMLLFCQDPSERIEERRIKVIGHSLKILDRMLATYCTCIDSEIVHSLIVLLSRMHRCSPLCLQWIQIDEKLMDIINFNISRGAEPMLSTAMKIADFKQTYFEHERETNADKLGYHLLTIGIMKRLIGMPFEQNCKWTLGAESIIDVAFSNINYLQEEICTGRVRLPGVHDIGERPRSASLYEATLVPICCLISQIPGDAFHAMELILLKHLLSNQLWASLLTSDVWCFVCRIGSSELCASHVKYLLKVYAALMKRGNSFEVIMLENLIGRLYNLLAEETKHKLITELDDPECPSWAPVCRFFPSRTRSFLQKRLACVLNEIPNTFADLQREPTVHNWNRVMSLMCLIGKLSYTGEKNTVDILSQIWNSLANTIEVFDGRQLDILSEFMSRLFDATQPKEIQDDAFFLILEALLASFLCFPVHAKIMASHYLRNNIDSFGNCGLKTMNALAELNCRLLEDENPWVRQEALESFDYVAHMCPNEDLVTKMAAAVTKRSSLNDSLPAYLSATSYYQFHDFADVQCYVEHVARHSENIRHVCSRYDDSQRDEKFAKFECESVASSSDENSDERVHKICDELSDVLKKRHEIGDQVLRRLRSICAQVLDLT